MELSSLHALIEDALDAFTGGWIERLYCLAASTAVAVSCCSAAHAPLAAGNGIFGPDIDDGIATGTSGSRRLGLGPFSKAVGPTGAPLQAWQVE